MSDPNFLAKVCSLAFVRLPPVVGCAIALALFFIRLYLEGCVAIVASIIWFAYFSHREEKGLLQFINGQYAAVFLTYLFVVGYSLIQIFAV